MIKQQILDEQLNYKNYNCLGCFVADFDKQFRPLDLMQKCSISQTGGIVFLFCIIYLGLRVEDNILIYCLLWLDLRLSLCLNHILFTASFLYGFLSILLFSPHIAILYPQYDSFVSFRGILNALQRDYAW